jgi:acetyltransferase EpsM
MKIHNPFCIYGAGGHCKVIIEIIENIDKKIHSLFEDNPSKENLFSYNLTNDPAIFQLESVQWIIGIGNNLARKKIAEEHELHYGLAIDKTARVSRRAVLGDGTVVMPGVTINSSTIIAAHCIVNTNSSVDHDCVLENYVHVSPNATLCGGVFGGEGTHVGAGAVVVPGINIGKWCTIGAGAVIIKDVPHYSTVVGNPGRIIKSEKQNEP